jgi:SpoU rRNA methylase family enzyme
MIIEQLERHRQEFALDHGWNVSVLESLDAAIKVLKQAPTCMIDKSNFSQEQYKTDLQCEYDCVKSILDKIRSEIEAEKNAGGHTWYIGGLDFALSVIDKYTAEREE